MNKNNGNNKPTEHSCCSSQKPDATAEHSCCSSQKPAATAEHSCCSSQKPATNTEHSCCSSQKPATNTEHSCCSSQKPATNTEHSCCDSNNNKSDSPNSLASEKQIYCSCCSTIDNSAKNTFWARRKGLIFLLTSLASLIASFVMGEFEYLHGTVWHYIDFGIIAVVLCGLPIMVRAIKNLIKGKKFSEKITSPLLISIAMLACITLQILIWVGSLETGGHSHSYIFAAGEVAWLMALGSYIEEFTIRKARSGIERLINLSPATAKVRINGELIEKPLSEISVGDIVTILPNDMISVDGEIISGSTSIDQAVMTGESVPVDKTVGDIVFGGTWNKSGAIEVRVTKAEDEMTINKLRKIVEEAEGKKAPISKLADKFASIIIPSAIMLSLLIFLVNNFIMDTGILPAIINSVTMLVVFCPCALALATPTAVAAGLGNTTKRGILVKSGGALEALAKTDILAFDKTGTLTYGDISVKKIVSYCSDKNEMLYLAGSAEMMSEHPIAKAISDYARQFATLAIPDNTKSLVGIGVEAQIDGKMITVRKWDNLSGSEFDYEFATNDAEGLLLDGYTLAAVICNQKLIGLIGLSDTIREGADVCIAELQKMGITSVMLTGDNRHVAENISKKAGINETYSSLMPEDKLSTIERLKTKSSGTVCMVGDGVNDAPALAAADCSLAIGTLGSDIAIETADAALMSGDIRKIPGLLRLARSMMTKIKLNIAISMTINFAAFLLSMFGLLNPVTGALVHNASSVLVVINSAFLLRKK